MAGEETLVQFQIPTHQEQIQEVGYTVFTSALDVSHVGFKRLLGDKNVKKREPPPLPPALGLTLELLHHVRPSG